MSLNNLPKLPFNEPVIVFTILITIILLAPIIFKKFRIPGIVGLIVSGIVIGPHTLNLVEFGESIKLLSTAGMLYLMFLVGIELNSRDLIRNKNKSFTFGALTFFVPFISGFIMGHFFLSYNLSASILTGIIFSTHTLIAYPIASKLGITKSEAVTATIGGTIIADTAALIVLAFISATTEGTYTFLFLIRIIFSISAFSFIILWGVPKISAWFFKNLEGESGSQYIFVLAILFTSGLLAKVAGVEPIIGAFLAGLAMNSIIPHTSALMNRISFIGNNFFIPIFLISVGMMVNLTFIFTDLGSLFLAVALVVVAIFSKFLAALIMQLFYKFTKTERQLIFGLSVSRAAAIISIVIVGYNLKLIGLDVLNGAILIILVSCFLGSFITERAGRKLAILESQKNPVKPDLPERIMVPVSNPETIEGLIDFAILIKESNSESPLHVLSVVPDDAFAENQILQNNKTFETAISHAAAADIKLIHVSRVDLNVANGISHAAKELMINKIVLGWNGKITTTNFFFGSIIEKLIGSTEQMVLVVKVSVPIITTRHVVVVISENADYEAGYISMLNVLKIIAARTSSSLFFTGSEKSLSVIRKTLSVDNSNIKTDYLISDSSHPLVDNAQKVNNQDLLIVIAARRRTLSYSHYLEYMPRDLERHYENKNFIIIYPEQRASEIQAFSPSLDGLEVSAIQENIGRFTNLSYPKRNAPKSRHNSKTE